MSHSRDQYFDIVKAFAIFLVVFGHVNSVLGLVPFPVWLGNMTVSINMPLFFMVSGYFCWPTVANGDWRRLGRHLRSYFQPTVVIIVAFTLLAPVAGLCSYAPASLILTLVYLDIGRMLSNLRLYRIALPGLAK